jgi:hypothetical protein
MTFNPGTDTFDQPLRDAWWTPGWTAQNDSYIPVPANQFKEQGFPPGLTYVTVSGNYFDLDGNFISGYVSFWPSSQIAITVGGGTATFPQRFVGMSNNQVGLNGFGDGRCYLWNGQLSVTLLATDNANMTPATFSYHVKEHWFEGQEYDINVPSSFASTGVDINSLIIPGSQIGISPAASQTIAAISTQYMAADITAMAGGIGANPTGYPVFFAFMSGTSEPSLNSWTQGQWAGTSSPYIAQILIGPANGGLALPVGSYTVWAQIVTPTQVPAAQVGTLVIY